MIQKNTYLIPNDKSGVWKVRVFHLYGGFRRKVTKISNFVKISVRLTRPENWVEKKTKLNSIVIMTKKEIKKKDGSYIRFSYNASILLKKRLTPKGKELSGPVPFQLQRKKFISSFPGII